MTLYLLFALFTVNQVAENYPTSEPQKSELQLIVVTSTPTIVYEKAIPLPNFTVDASVFTPIPNFTPPPTYTPQPTYTPEPTRTPEPTETIEYNSVFGENLTYELEYDTPEPRTSAPMSSQEIGSQSGISASTTPSDVWILVKQILIDIGLWQLFQSSYNIIFIIIVVFVLLSYLKPS